MKTKSTAFILTILGFIGIAGIQHFYLGNITKGLLWLFTLGLFGIGTLVDVFTIGSQVDNYNVKIELETIRAKAME